MQRKEVDVGVKPYERRSDRPLGRSLGSCSGYLVLGMGWLHSVLYVSTGGPFERDKDKTRHGMLWTRAGAIIRRVAHAWPRLRLSFLSTFTTVTPYAPL